MASNQMHVLETWGAAELRFMLGWNTFKSHQHLHYFEPIRGTLVVTGGIDVARMMPFEAMQNVVKKLAEHGTKHTSTSMVLQCVTREMLEWLRITEAIKYGLKLDSVDWLQLPAYLWNDSDMLEVHWQGAGVTIRFSNTRRQQLKKMLQEHQFDIGAKDIPKVATSYQRVKVGASEFRIDKPSLATNKSLFRYTWTDSREAKNSGLTGICYMEAVQFINVETEKGDVKVAQVKWYSVTTDGPMSNLTKIKYIPGAGIRHPYVLLTTVWQGNVFTLKRDGHLYLIDIAGQGGCLGERFKCA